MRSKHFATRRVSRSCSCQKPARNASATDRYRNTTVQMPVAPARSDPTPRRARNSSAPARENPTVFAMLHANTGRRPVPCIRVGPAVPSRPLTVPWTPLVCRPQGSLAQAAPFRAERHRRQHDRLKRGAVVPSADHGLRRDLPLLSHGHLRGTGNSLGLRGKLASSS